MFSQTNACFGAFQLSFHAVAFKLEPNSNSKGDRVVREARVSSEMHSFALNLAKSVIPYSFLFVPRMEKCHLLRFHFSLNGHWHKKSRVETQRHFKSS